MEAAHSALLVVMRRSVPASVPASGLGRGLALALGAWLALAGCRSGPSPELHVLGVQQEPRHDVVFVQVTNPASHAMRLTRLDYAFAAAGQTVSAGAVALARDVPAGAAVVVQIPLDSPPEQSPVQPMTLSGKLTAEFDQIVQIFSVSAQVAPPTTAQ
jgi:hypothetical protein